MKTLLSITFMFSLLLNANIIDQSKDISVCKGDEISLFVRASGTISSYQWYKDDLPINFNTSGLIIEESKFADAGNYHCQIIKETDQGTETLFSDRISVDVNQNTQVVSIDRDIRFEGDEQIWTFYADVHDDDLNENIFRWEFDSAIGNIEEIPGYSGIYSNFLVVRFKTKENNFDYVRKLRFIADGDCGVDTAFTEIVDLNLSITGGNPDVTLCEFDSISLKYKIDFDLPTELSERPLRVDLLRNDAVISSELVNLKNTVGSESVEFSVTALENTVGFYRAEAAFETSQVKSSSDTNRISYYPDIVINDRSNEPFSIRVGQPIKLRIWAEGSISHYIWIKEPNDTLKFGDQPFYEVLSSKPEDEGDYRCILKSQCGDTTLFFTVVFKENAIEENFLSVKQVIEKYNFGENKFYSITGREVDPRDLKKGLYFVIINGKAEKIIIK